MTICHIITRLIVGGAQENTLLSCEGLAARGHAVILISGPTAGPEGSLVQRAQRGSYRYVECPAMLRRIDPWHDAWACVDLCKLLRDIRPDVVHTHSSKAGILGRLAARRAGVPCVIHGIHGMSFNRTQPAPVRWAYRAAERCCARRTDHFVCVCNAMIDQAVAAGIAPRDRFTTIYSGMEVDLFDPAHYDRAAVRRPWGVSDEHVVAGAIARLFRNKGYEYLIPAMARAAAAEPSLRFVWIGDGAQRGEFERQLVSLGLRDRVTLTGLVAPERIPELLAGVDMLVHASAWEGLPRAVVQALLMEKPAISFDIDGAPEVVLPGETGILVPLGDAARMADAMVELARDPDKRRRLGAAGRRRCLPMFDHRLMVEQLERLYERTMRAAQLT